MPIYTVFQLIDLGTQQPPEIEAGTERVNDIHQTRVSLSHANGFETAHFELIWKFKLNAWLEDHMIRD